MANARSASPLWFTPASAMMKTLKGLLPAAAPV